MVRRDRHKPINVRKDNLGRCPQCNAYNWKVQAGLGGMVKVCICGYTVKISPQDGSSSSN